MDQPPHEPSGFRELFLGLFLGLVVFAGFLALLYMLCQGLAVAILAVVAGLLVVGLLHYFLWGYFLTGKVAKEKQEMEFREMMGEEEEEEP